MSTSRLEILRSMVAQKPEDAFARYGLATEHKNTGDLEEAVGEFRKLLEFHPRYTAAYFHGGQTLEKLGRVEEARAMYEKGIEAASASGDEHTRAELAAALEMLG